MGISNNITTSCIVTLRWKAGAVYAIHTHCALTNEWSHLLMKFAFNFLVEESQLNADASLLSTDRRTATSFKCMMERYITKAPHTPPAMHSLPLLLSPSPPNSPSRTPAVSPPPSHKLASTPSRIAVQSEAAPCPVQ